MSDTWQAVVLGIAIAGALAALCIAIVEVRHYRKHVRITEEQARRAWAMLVLVADPHNHANVDTLFALAEELDRLHGDHDYSTETVSHVVGS